MTSPLDRPPGDAIYIEKHRIYIEPPDLFIFVADGDVSVDVALRTQEAIAAFERDKDYIFLLADIAGMGAMPVDARKAASRPEATQRLRAFAVYGATFAQRVVLVLVIRAFSLLKGGDPVHIGAFDTEAEARAWLAERREAIQGKT